jgi:hypothetical protein
LEDALPDNDVVILSRTGGYHVGFFAGLQGDDVLILGGQPERRRERQRVPAKSQVLGVRRLTA